MKKIYSLFLLALAFNLSSFSQTLTIETDTAVGCHYVFVDITASSFTDSVAAISLFIDFDENAVQYIGKQNAIFGLSVNKMGTNRIGIVGSYAPNRTFINGVIVTLIFHYDGNLAALDWDQGSCEVMTDLLNPIICTYVDGAVTEGYYTFNTYYVDAARPSSGDGLSWATAKKTITEAANLSLKPGEQVWIKPGTYTEKVAIKSDGGYSVLPKTGVILSDTNKITFPAGTNLSCVDLVSFPDQYYAYVYRSWNSNNGYYMVIEVNDADDYVRVSNASFIPETGAVGNKGKVTAAVGRPIIYKKDPAALESERVIVNTTSLSSILDAFYIGKASGDGQTSADSCNWNIIQGIDITGGTNTVGLRIQCSAYNTFTNGKIYSATSGNGGIGAILVGTSSKNAKYNLIQGNEIYNTPYQGVMIGHTTTAVARNYSHFNHAVDNNFYLSGTSSVARFNNAVKVGYGDKSNVVEGNNFHDMKIYTVNNGALLVESKADSTLVYGNIFRNIDKVNTGTHACIMLNDSIKKVNVFNNIIYNDDTVTNAVYAFRVNGRMHSGSKLCYNTVYKIDNAFYLEDNSAGSATIDFGIHDNIISPTVNYFTHSGTSGRFTVTYNLFRFSPGTPYGSGTGNIFGDPLFVEPDGPSMYGLMLMPESPCIDTGLVISNISRDYLKISRSATEPTLGAFEGYMSGIYWTGAVNTDWHNYLNWELLIVPKTFMNVYIPNTTNDPLVSFNNAVCKSLNLSSGALLRVQSPRTITINN